MKRFAKILLATALGALVGVASAQVTIKFPQGAPTSGAVLFATTTSGQLGYSNVLVYGGGGTVATQLSATQTTSPTCIGACGVSPSVAGTDTAGTVTLGSTAATSWAVTFNSAWVAAPSCMVVASKGGMAATKIPIVVSTSTTQFVVTNSSVAPSAADTYNYVCFGIK